MISTDTQQILASIANLVTILGIFFGIIGSIIAISSYRAERRKDRLEREYGTFDDLDDKYVEFMYMCTNHLGLDLFSDPAPSDRIISKEELKAERALFAVLISIFERAFLIFERHSEDAIKQRQYPGWVECMRSYCTRESFLFEWDKIGSQFDSSFQLEMNNIIQEEKTKQDRQIISQNTPQ